MTIICIHQPAFCPWLGILESMFACEVFVHLDDVQYEDGGVQNRNRIKTAAGPAWLTIPVSHDFGTLVKDVVVAQSYKPAKLLKTLTVSYGRAEFFDEMMSILWPICSQRHSHLVEYSIPIIENVAARLGAPCRFVRSSQLPGASAQRIERVAQIYHGLQADVLYTGSGMKKYCTDADFRRYEIKPLFHNYQERHVIYNQRFPQMGFAPNLSFIDYVANCGIKVASHTLRNSAANTLDGGMQQFSY